MVDADELLPDGFRRARGHKLLAVKDIIEGTRQYLDEAIGVQEIGSHDTMTVRAPTPGEAAASAFRRTGASRSSRPARWASTRGNPVRVTITIYPSDRNTFSMETGELAQLSAHRARQLTPGASMVTAPTLPALTMIRAGH